MIKIRLVYILSFLCFNVEVSAQLISLKEEDHLQIGKVEGIGDLNLYGVNSIIKDRFHFLWIGSKRGLYRFDGVNYNLYYHNLNNKNSIVHDKVNTFLEDSKGRLWIGTSEGVCYYSYLHDKFYTINENEGMQKNREEIFSIVEDTEHRIWIGSINNLYYIDEVSTCLVKVRIQNHKTENLTWHRLYSDHSDCKLYAACREGFLVIDSNMKQEFIAINFKSNDNATTCNLQLNPFNTDELVVSYFDQGLVFFNKKTKAIRQEFFGNKLKQYDNFCLSILQFRDGFLLNREFEIQHYNSKKGTNKFVLLRNYLDTNRLSFSTMYLSKDSILFIGASNGLYRLNLGSKLINHQLTIPNMGLGSIIYDSTHHTLYDIEVYNKKNKITRIDLHKMQSNLIGYLPTYYNMVAVEAFILHDNIYIRTNYGYYILDVKSKIIKPWNIRLPDGSKLNPSLHYKCAFDDSLLFLAKDDSLLFIDRNNFDTKVFSSIISKEKKNSIWSIAQFEDKVWFSDANYNLYSFNKQTFEIKKYALPKRINELEIDVPIIRLLDTKNRQLWLSYSNGGLIIYHIDKEKVVRILSFENGFFANVIHDIKQDDEGYLWCTTSSDWLYKINSKTFEITHYNQYDDLPNFDINSSLLYIGSNKMLICQIPLLFIQTDFKSMNMENFHISITSFTEPKYHYKPDSSLLLTNHIKLPALHQTFNIGFAVVDIEKGKSWRYAYILNDDNKKWIELETQSNLTFTNLEPGSHTLHLKAYKPGENNSAVYKDIFISIEYKFYQTIWFKIILLLLVLTILILFIQFYFRQQLKRKQVLLNERNRIAGEMHDDLGLGLTKIRYISEDLKNADIGVQNKENLDQLIYHSNDLIDNLNDIIWTIKEPEDKLEDFTYLLKALCYDLLERTNIHFESIMPSVFPDLSIHHQARRNIYLICKEFIHNSIKHSNAEQIFMTIQFQNEMMVLELKDNGKGFDIASNGKGNGIQNFEKRCNQLQGWYQINSDHTGTKIQFTFPLKNICLCIK